MAARLGAVHRALAASTAAEPVPEQEPTVTVRDPAVEARLARLAAQSGGGAELLEPVHTAAEVVERVRRVGFCVLADVVAPAEAAAVAASVIEAVHSPAQEAAEKEWEATRARGHRIGTPGVRSLKQLLRVTTRHAQYLADPRLIAAAEALFGGDSSGSQQSLEQAAHPTFVRISCNDANVCMEGSSRGYWHADWPYNATNATHVPPPYPAGGSEAPLLHLTTIFMFTDFDERRGGTYVLPGSHVLEDNPAAGRMAGFPPETYEQPIAGELQLRGAAGSVFVSDSRLWHAIAPNVTQDPRVGLLVRYAPWWLNLAPTIQGTSENERMVKDYGGKNYDALALPEEVFEQLPAAVKPLLSWNVDRG